MRDGVEELAVDRVEVEVRVPVALGRDDELLPPSRNCSSFWLTHASSTSDRTRFAAPVPRETSQRSSRLQPVRRPDGDRAVVRQPLHSEDVLVARGGLVHPGRLVAADLDDPELYRGIGIARFG